MPSRRGVATRHECGPGRRADRSRVEPIELDAFACQPVDRGGVDRASVVPDVGPAQVVREDHHDVRSRRQRDPWSADGQQAEGAEREPDGYEIGAGPTRTSAAPASERDRFHRGPPAPSGAPGESRIRWHPARPATQSNLIDSCDLVDHSVAMLGFDTASDVQGVAPGREGRRQVSCIRAASRAAPARPRIR